LRENSRIQSWTLSLLLIVIASSMLWCGSLDAPVRAQNPPSQTAPTGTIQSFMIKWALFAVPPGQNGEFLLGQHDFGSPILLHGLEILADPDTDVDSLSELYVMQEDLPITSAPAKVLGYGATWTRHDPFRSEVLMFPKPIYISTGTIVVRGFLQNMSTSSVQNESGDVVVYYEPAS